MLITKNKFNKLDIITLLLNILLIILSLYNTSFSKYLLLATSWTNVILLYKSRNQKSFFIMFIFWFTYILYLYNYFFFGIQLSVYKIYQNDYNFTLTLIVHSIFLGIFNLYFKTIKYKEDIKNKIRIKDNSLFFLGSILIMVFIIIFGKSGENIFSAGGYGKNITSNFLNLAIYEYYYIFFLLAIKYSKLKKDRLIIIFLISFFYIIKNLLFGGRVESLQLLLLIFLLFMSFKISNKLFYFGVIIGYYFFELFGRIRGNPSIIFEGLNILNPFNLNRTIIMNNQTDVFYNSTAFIGLVNDNLFDLEFRIKSFLYFILGLFVPSKYIPQEYTLWTAGRNLGVNYGGGGLISSITYTWLGVFGVILIAIFFAKIFNKFNHSKNEYVNIYIIMLLTTFPRWFAYSPITAFKLSVYSVVIFWIVDKLEEVFSKKKSSFYN